MRSLLTQPDGPGGLHLMGGAQGNAGVLAAAASGLCSFIEKHGGDPDRILGMSGIDPEALGHPTLSLALPNYCQVLEEASRQSGCDNFGLYYGQQFKPQALGLLGYIGLCSATVEQALINFARAFPLHQRNSLIRLVDDGECYRFDYQVRHGAILCRRQDAELTLGMALNLVRHGLGSQWAPRAVHFEHPRPEHWHEHCKVFDAPVYFEQPFNSLLIPKRGLQRAMPQGDPVLLLVMQDSLSQLSRLSGRGELPITDDVRERVRQQLLIGEPVLEDVAAQMGMTSWSLQRRLREQNLSFSMVVDQLRRELATHYLRQHQLPISDLAPLLGYSETSAFSRAFRRWFGVSPRQWRREG
ncbi:AraC family transcriptional regulator [Pseudomonas sp. DTU_2021_1001937_2_SI_NGA_ILE_001]|uniref:AraC-like transcriptional regulator QhpR n=1 Tax=Pseudomonas sp. DTU_2021_1001937_2_SI_NGA_ILE_001 TaxID=3077589 RepID=UPI0025E623A0|nr:AraC family transcriptional regulator [Pseudomonas sp. DTU_2021_1001937_2_SI_NGA_ILE_001]WNW12279.1 AraC family transcriptional regulator [Pseudomonas sp. DTU_2021_1001937_2_SI_NGA_ILE_001]